MKSGTSRILTECAACLRGILDVPNLFWIGFRVNVLMQGDPASHKPSEQYLLYSFQTPKRLDRHREKTLSKTDRVLAVIKHNTSGESRATDIIEFSEPAKICVGDRRRRLTLDTRNVPPCDFQHDIHTVAVFVTAMMETDGVFVPTCLPPQLLKYESFQQPAEQGAVFRQSSRIQDKQARHQPRISEMQLGRLHQT